MFVVVLRVEPHTAITQVLLNAVTHDGLDQVLALFATGLPSLLAPVVDGDKTVHVREVVTQSAGGRVVVPLGDDGHASFFQGLVGLQLVTRETCCNQVCLLVPVAPTRGRDDVVDREGTVPLATEPTSVFVPCLDLRSQAGLHDKDPSVPARVCQVYSVVLTD